MDCGGFALLPPEVFLCHQAAYSYVWAVSRLDSFAPEVMADYQRWVCKIGYSLEPCLFPYLQLGMVRTHNLSFMTWSTQAFSLVRRRVNPICPSTDLSEVPLWHSVFFRNAHQHTYCNTALIAQGVVTWGDVMVEENVRMIRSPLATWRPVYLRGRSLMTSIRPGSFDQPTRWYLLWGRGFFSQLLAPDLSYPCRQSPEVRADFLDLRVGPETKEFVRVCLWNKLSVHSRYATVMPRYAHYVEQRRP